METEGLLRIGRQTMHIQSIYSTTCMYHIHKPFNTYISHTYHTDASHIYDMQRPHKAPHTYTIYIHYTHISQVYMIYIHTTHVAHMLHIPHIPCIYKSHVYYALNHNAYHAYTLHIYHVHKKQNNDSLYSLCSPADCSIVECRWIYFILFGWYISL